MPSLAVASLSAPAYTGSPTEGALLEAGEFLFQRQGYHGTSMRQLARYAGVTPAAIYNHFSSKEDLFIAVLRARLPHRALAEALSQAQGGSPADLLRDGIARMHAALEGRLEKLRLGFVELLEFEGRHLPEVLPEMVHPALGFVERLREMDPRLRAWPPVLALRLIAGGFFSFAISGAYLPAALQEGPGEFDRLAAFLAAGLFGAAPPERAGS